MKTSLRAAALVVGLALRVCAAPAASGAPAGNGLPAAKAPYWLKAYSTAPVQENWSATLALKNFDADLPKVLKAISDEGGALTQDPKSFVSSRTPRGQQLILTIPKERAKGLLKAWRRLGDLPAPQTLSTGAAIPVDEVRAKIDRLMKERVERAAELAKLPVAQELEDEVLEHLLLIEEVGRDARAPVRIDLSVRQR
jgi:hypothetical protein